MHVGEILERQVETLLPDATVFHAAQLMRDHNVSFVLVVEGERLAGVVTDRDIVLRCVASSLDPDTTPVHEVMSLEVVCCPADESVEHAKAMMAAHNLQRLPVIDAHHHLIGLVTRADLEGEETLRKKAVKVTFLRQKTDSYGRPHKVTLKTIYVTGIGDKSAAEAAAVRQMEAETGGPWESVATDMESEMQPTEDRGRSR